jgi:hypothetical protein
VRDLATVSSALFPFAGRMPFVHGGRENFRVLAVLSDFSAHPV